MHLGGKLLDSLGQFMGQLGRAACSGQCNSTSAAVCCGKRLALHAGPREVFAMRGVGLRVSLVAIRLAGLGQQDERRRVGGLEAERKIQQDEGIGIEPPRKK